jgi:hypothetical protein
MVMTGVMDEQPAAPAVNSTFTSGDRVVNCQTMGSPHSWLAPVQAALNDSSSTVCHPSAEAVPAVARDKAVNAAALSRARWEKAWRGVVAEVITGVLLTVQSRPRMRFVHM